MTQVMLFAAIVFIVFGAGGYGLQWTMAEAARKNGYENMASWYRLGARVSPIVAAVLAGAIVATAKQH